MTKEIAAQILDMYRHESKETMKDNIPVNYNGTKYWGATNAKEFVLIPESEENKWHLPLVTTVNIEAILPQKNSDLVYPISRVQAALDSIEMVDIQIMKECNECEDGTFAKGMHTYECKECEGEGKIWTGKTKKAPDPNKVIDVEGLLVNQDFIRRLMKVAKAVEAAELKLVFIKNERPLLLFELPEGILVGICTLMELDEDQTTVLI